MHVRELQSRLEKTEASLELERKQSEKLSRNYSELLGKFNNQAREFDSLVEERNSDNEKATLSLKLQVEDYKSKLLDYEVICEKMDREIKERAQEMKRLNLSLDKTSGRNRELEGLGESLREKLREKENEGRERGKEKENQIETLKMEIDKCMEMAKEREGELMRVISEKEALLMEVIRKKDENEGGKITELEEVTFFFLYFLT